MKLLDRLRSLTVIIGQPLPTVWCACYKQLCTVFEGLVRAMTATVQAAALLDDQTVVAAILQAADGVGQVTGLFCSVDCGVLSRVAADAP
jgi:hypothetical protein